MRIKIPSFFVSEEFFYELQKESKRHQRDVKAEVQALLVEAVSARRANERQEQEEARGEQE